MGYDGYNYNQVNTSPAVIEAKPKMVYSAPPSVTVQKKGKKAKGGGGEKSKEVSSSDSAGVSAEVAPLGVSGMPAAVLAGPSIDGEAFTKSTPMTMMQVCRFCVLCLRGGKVIIVIVLKL
jgi:hypothetical protein